MMSYSPLPAGALPALALDGDGHARAGLAGGPGQGEAPRLGAAMACAARLADSPSGQSLTGRAALSRCGWPSPHAAAGALAGDGAGADVRGALEWPGEPLPDISQGEERRRRKNK